MKTSPHYRSWPERFDASWIGLAASALMLVAYAASLAWAWPDLPELVHHIGSLFGRDAQMIPKSWYLATLGVVPSSALLIMLFDGLRGRGPTMRASHLSISSMSAIVIAMSALALHHDVTGAWLLSLGWARALIFTLALVHIASFIAEERRIIRADVEAVLAEEDDVVTDKTSATSPRDEREDEDALGSHPHVLDFGDEGHASERDTASEEVAAEPRTRGA